MTGTWTWRAWREMDRRSRVALYALAALVVAGVGLRVAFMVAYQPALLGYPDSRVYLNAAQGGLFYDPFRVAGYAAFLRALHDVTGSLSLLAFAQHVLGVGTAVLLFDATRRLGAPAWLGLVPAGVVLLGGEQLFLEHAVLTEALTTFLVAAALAAAVRCLDSTALGWALAAGALLGLSGTVRLAALPLAAVLVAWLALVPAPSVRSRALRAGVGAAGAAVVLVGYLLAAHGETERWSFTRSGAYSFYGRVATFADCSRFSAPSRTERLCETRPPLERNGPQWYIFHPASPALRPLGKEHPGELSRREVDDVSAFARAAAWAQPDDWIEASARDFARYVAPGSFERPFDTLAPGDYPAALADPRGTAELLRLFDPYYGTGEADVRPRLADALRDYGRWTRVQGVVMALLLALAVVAPLVCRGRRRWGALLLASAGIAILVVPVVTINYDARLGVPAYGPLAAAAALGGYGAVRGGAGRLGTRAFVS